MACFRYVTPCLGVSLCRLQVSPSKNKILVTYRLLCPGRSCFGCYAAHTLRNRDSSVGIATRYGLFCPGFESLPERDFSSTQNRQHVFWSHTCPLIIATWVISEDKILGAYTWSVISINRGDFEWVELYICSTDILSWSDEGQLYLYSIPRRQ